MNENEEEKKSILIVDDDEWTCRSLSLICGKKDYETETAETGREAIEKAQGRFFNVVLLDIRLPDMEGVDLLVPLKEMHPDMALIIVTGYASLKTAVQALNRGASGYITKPLNMDEVLFKVRDVLEKQHLTVENRRLYLVAQKELAERRSMEEHLRQSQKMEAIGTLAGGIAHDFNNILTTIIGNATLALMDIDKDSPLREEIEEIKKAGERAASLTRQLLAFSRKQIVQPTILNLNELVEDLEKMIRRLLGEDIELLVIQEPELWQVKMDPGQIEQIIMNIAVNAKDAMPTGGKLTIETAKADLDDSYFRNHGLKEAQPGSYVMLAVCDTGSGMTKDIQEHIFEPFFTTKEIGKGTGLGLPTVYGIVKQNKGFIWVYSELGQGSTIKIYLPKAKGEAASEKEEQPSVGALGGSETILVVEDYDSLRKLAQTVLEKRGYTVLEAENGEDALKVAETHDGSIDLMITDVVMPKMGGKEVANRLQLFYPHMKVIYMSGYTNNAIVHHNILQTGLNFIQKPFTPDMLARKVREILNS